MLIRSGRTSLPQEGGVGTEPACGAVIVGTLIQASIGGVVTPPPISSASRKLTYTRPMERNLRRIVWTAFLATTLVLAGCGGSSGAKTSDADALGRVLAAVKGLSGKAREQRLLQLAKAEGDGLTFYTTYSLSLLGDVADAFKDKYDIDVSTYKGGSGDVLQRLLEESKAGYHGADVIEANGFEMIATNKEGLLQPYTTPAAANLIEGARHDGWTADAVNTFVVVRNTKLVSPEQQPKSWEDLADPQWKGKLGITIADVDWYKTLRDYWVAQEGKTPEEADRLLDAIARNAVFIKGHSLGAQLQSAGEFELFVNYIHIVEGLARDGAPLDWKPPVEPLFVRTDGTGLVRGARHPAAALLFIDWLLGDGQKVLADAGVAVRKDLISTRGAKTVLVDLPSFAAQEQKWDDRYDRLVRLGGRLQGG
ncbi:MAG: ABC transporter substrate-binding protein [Gaiellaceae bacterium]